MLKIKNISDKNIDYVIAGTVRVIKPEEILEVEEADYQVNETRFPNEIVIYKPVVKKPVVKKVEKMSKKTSKRKR